MRIGSLFSGYGGLEQGVQSVLGGSTAWVSDIDPGACKILAHRYPDVPNLGDISTVDWSAVEPVDVLTGGFPCQDVSCAGLRKGLRPDTRSGLWTQMAYAIDQLRPALVVAENVRGLLSAEAHSDLEPCPWCVGDGSGVPLRALGAVLGDLADLGYDASWTGIRAADVGAPHGRFRVFVIAWPADSDRAGSQGAQPAARRLLSDGRAAADTERGRRQAGPFDGAPLGTGGRTQGEEPEPRRAASTAADRGGVAATTPHPDSLGHERSRRARDGRTGSADGAVTAAHASSDGRHERRPESARLVGGSDAALSGAPVAADADRDGLEGVGRLQSIGRDTDGRRGADVAWGQYEPAIRRWERLTRPAPAPTEPGKTGQLRLSPAFVEWMQGLPAGWVTDIPGLTRNEQLKALGNGVVPQQAAAALSLLLPHVRSAAA